MLVSRFKPIDTCVYSSDVTEVHKNMTLNDPNELCVIEGVSAIPVIYYKGMKFTVAETKLDVREQLF